MSAFGCVHCGYPVDTTLPGGVRLPDGHRAHQSCVDRAWAEASAQPAPDNAQAGHRLVTVELTAEQATALYDLACWALDADENQGSLWQTGPSAVEPTALKGAADALITGGAEGKRYV